MGYLDLPPSATCKLDLLLLETAGTAQFVGGEVIWMVTILLLIKG